MPDGTIGKATACAQGICRNTSNNQLADGRFPGACDTTPQCKAGETKCADGGGGGSLCQTCVNGFGP